MNTYTNPVIDALSNARAISNRRHLNSGQSLTLVIIKTYLATNNVTSIDRNTLYSLSPLSRSSVDSHIREMSKSGILLRNGEDIYAPIAQMGVTA